MLHFSVDSRGQTPNDRRSSSTCASLVDPDMSNSEQSSPGLLSVVALSATVAATIAVTEAGALLVAGKSVTPRAAVALVLTGAAVYAGVAAAVAAAWVALRRRRLDARRTPPAAAAIAAAIAGALAVAVVSLSDRPIVGHPVVLAALLGTAALAYSGMRRLVVALPRLQRLDLWLGLLAILLTTTLLGFTGAASVHPASVGNPEAPSVLLVTIDTLRSDHLGAYGYAEAQSPHIDRLAAEGATFLEALSPMPETGPAHASILSGLYPWHHGAARNGIPMATDVTTVADILRARGYATAAIVSGWTVSAAASGLAPHFAFYDDSFSRYGWFPDAIERLRLVNVIAWATGRWGVFRPRHERRATATSHAALEWLAHQHGLPFFLWAHFYDPHGPYEPPAQFAAAHRARNGNGRPLGWYRQSPEAREAVLQDPTAVQDMIARYDGEITYTDLHFARIREAAERAAAGRPLLIVLTADHGESLTEHGHFFDHLDLYDVNLRVPLIVHYPGRITAGTRIPGQTRLIDIAPTVMDLLGLPPLPRGDGVSLVQRLNGQADHASEPALAHSPRGPRTGGSVWAARAGNYKLLTTESWWTDTLRFPPSEELYDLRTDPGETQTLACDGTVADRLRAALTAVRREHTERAEPTDPGVQERLRALGYGN